MQRTAKDILRDAHKWAGITDYELGVIGLVNATVDDIGVFFSSPPEAYEFSQAIKGKQDVEYRTADAEVHYVVNARGAKEYAWHAMLAKYRVRGRPYTITTVVPQEVAPVRASEHPFFANCKPGDILHAGCQVPDYEGFLTNTNPVPNVLARLANGHGMYAYLGSDDMKPPYLKPRNYR
jgi:hypothetical protein